MTKWDQINCFKVIVSHYKILLLFKKRFTCQIKCQGGTTNMQEAILLSCEKKIHKTGTYLYYTLKVYSFCEDKVDTFGCIAQGKLRDNLPRHNYALLHSYVHKNGLSIILSQLASSHTLSLVTSAMFVVLFICVCSS